MIVEYFNPVVSTSKGGDMIAGDKLPYITCISVSKLLKLGVLDNQDAILMPTAHWTFEASSSGLERIDSRQQATVTPQVSVQLQQRSL